MKTQKLISGMAMLVLILLFSTSVNAIIKEDSKDLKFAVIETNKGIIKFELYTDKAPNTTANFIKLANDGFYSGLVFHRVIPEFMIQGGGFHPDGNQKQSPYGAIKLEINPELTHVDGAVAMARTNDPDSATSQFYICDGPQSFLDGKYAVFGKVVDGMDVVRSIASAETTTKHQFYENWPVDEVIITKISIESNTNKGNESSETCGEESSGSCSIGVVCGDKKCEGNETCQTCNSDCGECQKNEKTVDEIPWFLIGLIVVLVPLILFYIYKRKKDSGNAEADEKDIGDIDSEKKRINSKKRKKENSRK